MKPLTKDQVIAKFTKEIKTVLERYNASIGIVEYDLLYDKNYYVYIQGKGEFDENGNTTIPKFEIEFSNMDGSRMNTKEQEFKKELKALLSKYNAAIESDGHGNFEIFSPTVEDEGFSFTSGYLDGEDR